MPKGAQLEQQPSDFPEGFFVQKFQEVQNV